MKVMRLYTLLISSLLCSALFSSPPLMANSDWDNSHVATPEPQPSLALIYPDVDTSSNEIFTQIIAGIETQHGQPLIKRLIANKASPEDSIDWITQQNPDMLIALGKRGYRIAKRLYKERPVVIGALPIRPNGISGISLSADPVVLLNFLLDLAPNIRKIHVVHSPASRWLIDLALSHADKRSLVINPVEVRDLKSALESYDQLLNYINNDTEALWLPRDSITAHEQVILPKLLEASWEQKLTFFSSTASHAKRGALFSVLPDYQALGEQLVEMSTTMHRTNNPAGVIPLGQLKLAVNLKTAVHLGYDYTAEQKQQFHLTFPQPLP